MDNAYLQAQITKIKAQIELYNTAINAIIIGGAESYSLDTGQSIQKVTKLNVASLQKVLDGLYNQLDVFQQRLNGNGSVTVRPQW